MVHSHYLSREASEARVRALGPILAERYREDLRRATPVTWQVPALLRLATAHLMDPDNKLGMIDDAVARAIV